MLITEGKNQEKNVGLFQVAISVRSLFGKTTPAKFFAKQEPFLPTAK
jgi:hypothetical protein